MFLVSCSFWKNDLFENREIKTVNRKISWNFNKEKTINLKNKGWWEERLYNMKGVQISPPHSFFLFFIKLSIAFHAQTIYSVMKQNKEAAIFSIFMSIS